MEGVFPPGKSRIKKVWIGGEYGTKEIGESIRGGEV